MPVKKAQQQ